MQTARVQLSQYYYHHTFQQKKIKKNGSRVGFLKWNSQVQWESQPIIWVAVQIIVIAFHV